MKADTRKQVWKFEVNENVDGSRPTRMPEGAEILHVEMVDARVQVWALVHPDQPMVERWFRVIGTGWPTDVEASGYLGTVFTRGRLVFHVFETDGPDVR